MKRCGRDNKLLDVLRRYDVNALGRCLALGHHALGQGFGLREEAFSEASREELRHRKRAAQGP